MLLHRRGQGAGLARLRQGSGGLATCPRPSSTCWSAKASKGQQRVQGSPAPTGLLRLGRFSVVSKVFALFVFVIKTPKGLLSSSAPAGWLGLRLLTCPSSPSGTSSHHIRVNFDKTFNFVYCQRGVNKPKTIQTTNLCGSCLYPESSSILSPGVPGRVTNIKVFV